MKLKDHPSFLLEPPGGTGNQKIIWGGGKGEKHGKVSQGIQRVGAQVRPKTPEEKVHGLTMLGAASFQ